MHKFLLAGAAAALLAAPTLAQPGQGMGRGPAQPIARAAVQTMIQARFARADANRDGFVTQAELAARAGARGERKAERAERRHARQPGQARSPEQIARRFERLDTNRDGQISRAEFGTRQAARAERRAGAGEGRARGGRGGMGMGIGLRAFARVDANGDGRVSLAEATARGLSAFDRIDANRDGMVTAEERRAARHARRAG
jgi:Ca2+-binding EF-hand superfamily protein